MPHYDFKPSDKRKNRNTYKGSWSEPTPKRIDLPFTVESLEKVLIWGINSKDSPFSHQDLAHWCDCFHMAMFDVDTDENMDVATGIAADVDAQWDMFLANTYTLEELQKLDFSKIQLPEEWFQDWLNELKK